MAGWEKGDEDGDQQAMEGWGTRFSIWVRIDSPLELLQKGTMCKCKNVQCGTKEDADPLQSSIHRSHLLHKNGCQNVGLGPGRNTHIQKISEMNTMPG